MARVKLRQRWEWLYARIERADLVTEMTLVKHPFREQGVKAQPGIEF